jgi:predicted nuclease of predicted toxin-antitoxin system
MKVLLDTCIAPGARDELRAAGHDVVWAGDWKEDPGDEVILAKAHEAGRVLITLDKDFGEFGVVRRTPHRGIIRIVDFRSGHQGAVGAKILAAYADDLIAGAIITAQPGRVRIRRP